MVNQIVSYGCHSHLHFYGSHWCTYLFRSKPLYSGHSDYLSENTSTSRYLTSLTLRLTFNNRFVGQDTRINHTSYIMFIPQENIILRTSDAYLLYISAGLCDIIYIVMRSPLIVLAPFFIAFCYALHRPIYYLASLHRQAASTSLISRLISSLCDGGRTRLYPRVAPHLQ